MLNCEYLRYYHEAINGKKTANYHKTSGAADSLYSRADLFFTALEYRLMLQGGLQIARLLCPLPRPPVGILLQTYE